MRVLIIGGVAGGANTATRLRRLDGNAEIVIFERGDDISYAACGLPYFIGGVIESVDALRLQTAQSLCEHYNIDVRVYSNVRSIDSDKKSVTVENLKTGKSYTEPYDKLVVATGAKPIRPPIAGLDSKGVFTLRTIADAEKIKNYIENKRAKSVLIVGGGSIGVELTENFKLLGLDVAIAELTDHLIAQLDVDMAGGVHTYMKDHGVKLILGNGAENITESADGLTVKLREGEIKTDLLIMGVGVSPDSELAREAGLELTERGAIIVNRQMLTSDPDIYAVGDVVQTYSFITGQPARVAMAGPASRQARVAADNLAGIASEYGGALGTGIIKLFDMTIAFTGLSERETAQNGLNYDKILIAQPPHTQYYPGGREMNIKIVFDRATGKILGAQLVGFEGVDKRCDVLAMAIRMGATADDLMGTDFAYSPPYGMPKDPINVAGQIINNMMKKRRAR